MKLVKKDIFWWLNVEDIFRSKVNNVSIKEKML